MRTNVCSSPAILEACRRPTNPPSWTAEPRSGSRPSTPATNGHSLTEGAWVEVRRNWVSGSDGLFDQLSEAVPWRAERRRMYDRVLDVPRLVAFYDENEQLPDPTLATMRSALSEEYWPELGEPFRTVGLCLYRDGNDSVAWHGDTIGRRQCRRHAGGDRLVGRTEELPLAPTRRRSLTSLRSGKRRPIGDGWELPAHVGTLRAQTLPRARAPDQHSVSSGRGPLKLPARRWLGSLQR